MVDSSLQNLNFKIQMLVGNSLKIHVSTCSQINATLVTHHVHYYVKCWHRRNKECPSICEKSIENSTKCEQCAKNGKIVQWTNVCVYEWMHNFQILKSTGVFFLCFTISSTFFQSLEYCLLDFSDLTLQLWRFILL